MKAQIKVVKDDFTPRITVLARRVGDTRVPNRKLSVKLYGWVIRNFNSSGGLQKKPWKPLKEATLKSKRKKGYSPKPLIRTGNLRNSFEGYFDAKIAGVGARASFGIDYAEVHEYGSRSRNIPARSMLPDEDTMRKFAVEVYEGHLADAIRGAKL